MQRSILNNQGFANQQTMSRKGKEAKGTRREKIRALLKQGLEPMQVAKVMANTFGKNFKSYTPEIYKMRKELIEADEKDFNKAMEGKGTISATLVPRAPANLESYKEWKSLPVKKVPSVRYAGSGMDEVPPVIPRVCPCGCGVDLHAVALALSHEEMMDKD